MSLMKNLLLAVALITTINNLVECRPTKSLNGRKVVLISMDGFRHNYLSRTKTPNFDAVIASGVKVPYVNNTFTTLTFPCHYTIVTGRYEESHGIVDNHMYDPEFNATFGMTNTETRWWDGAEPIWTNAVKAGLKTGVYFWPGSATAIDGIRPNEWKPYNYRIPFETRVDTVVSKWLSQDAFDFGVIYFNEPDHSGHKYGPEAPEMVPVIERMDKLLGYFIQRLEKENIKDKVDFILTSDHGMTTIFQDKKIIGIRDLVNSSLLIDVVGGGAIAHLRPQPGKAQELVQALSGVDHMTVYLKEDIPERYHYTHHRRILPVVAIADEGYEIREISYRTHYLKGNHGFSTDSMNMKPIFIASGPSFKQGVEVDPIKQVDIYPLLCHLLNLDPAPNNGSFDRVRPMLRTAPKRTAETSTTPVYDVGATGTTTDATDYLTTTETLTKLSSKPLDHSTPIQSSVKSPNHPSTVTPENVPVANAA